MSTFGEQQKLLDVLKKYERNFTRQEYDEYRMFLKRQKDDEDFDSVSMKRLKELYDKYYKPVNISKFDKFFKNKPGNNTD
jgi:hypothetical protein